MTKMDPLNDDELRQMLRTWEAPNAPDSLRRAVRTNRFFWVRWLLTGTLRIPVPVGVAVTILIVGLMWTLLRPSRETETLGGFQVVDEIRLKVIRSENVSN
jgi:hypothetical protein